MKDRMESKVWQALIEHQKALKEVRIVDLFANAEHRFEEMSCEAAGVFLDFSKNIATPETLRLLKELAKECRLPERIHKLIGGAYVNTTEKRQALHTALRSHNPNTRRQEDDVASVLKKMEGFVESVHAGDFCGYSGKRITDIVNIGIGGSDLGPLMVTEALKPYQVDTLKCHFVSNIDASDICETLKQLDPATTLFIVASKTFTTVETLTNATTARSWLLEHSGSEEATKNHFVAVTANVDNAVGFGITEDNIFPMWDWVGGRYSLWSAIGLPIALAVGMNSFNRLRAGAASMDYHFLDAPLERNLPVLMGLLGVWYTNFWDAHTHAVLPYDHYLRYFTKYLQQLDMESNGKRVTLEGETLDVHSGPVVWGDAGTNGQHSFHQLLHQGTRLIPADFIAPLKSHHPVGDHHSLLFANCLAQSRALMTGKSIGQAEREFLELGYTAEEAATLAPHKVMPGNLPSNTLIIEQVTPETLGALIALYEHKVYVQSVIWDINAFDQWGVELGKKLCHEIHEVIEEKGNADSLDTSTLGLIQRYQGIS